MRNNRSTKVACFSSGAVFFEALEPRMFLSATVMPWVARPHFLPEGAFLGQARSVSPFVLHAQPMEPGASVEAGNSYGSSTTATPLDPAMQSGFPVSVQSPFGWRAREAWLSPIEGGIGLASPWQVAQAQPGDQWAAQSDISSSTDEFAPFADRGWIGLRHADADGSVWSIAVSINQQSAATGQTTLAAGASDSTSLSSTGDGLRAAIGIVRPGFELEGAYGIPVVRSLGEFEGLIHIWRGDIAVENLPATTPEYSPTAPSKAALDPGSHITVPVAAQSGAVATPLALTPTPASVAVPMASSGPSHSIFAALKAAMMSSAMPTVAMSSGAMHASMPTAPLAVITALATSPRGAALATAGLHAATGVISDTGDIADQESQMLAAIAAPQSLVQHAAYSFVHLSPAAIVPDAIAAFVNHWASLAPAESQPLSTTGAWAITASVLALDAVLLGAWYRRGRRQLNDVKPDPHAASEAHLEGLGNRLL